MLSLYAKDCSCNYWTCVLIGGSIILCPSLQKMMFRMKGILLFMNWKYHVKRVPHGLQVGFTCYQLQLCALIIGVHRLLHAQVEISHEFSCDFPLEFTYFSTKCISIVFFLSCFICGLAIFKFVTFCSPSAVNHTVYLLSILLT